MSKLADTTQEELFDLIAEGLNETEKTYLGGKNKEINTNILKRLVDAKYDNELFANVPVATIADGLRDDFVKAAMQGETYKLIYVGGLDIFERFQPVDRSQMGLFYDIEEKEFVEHKVWGRYPGFKETDPFVAGHLYEIEIVPKVVSYPDGDRTFYNLRKYKFLEDRTEFISDIIQNTKELGTIIEEAADGEFTEATVTLLFENLKYQTTPMKFEILSVRPVGQTQRTETVDDEGKTAYSNIPVREKNPDTGVEEVIPLPFVTSSDTGVTSTTFAITGKAALGEDREIIYFGTFYPSRMGQYFINSETISAAINDEKFLNQDPDKQADYLKYLLVGKEFTGVGNVRRVEAGNDPSKLSMNINMLALVEA
ncbi:hypothetical protein LCGC14_0368220 [marine sediment metagenome]|uniref:Uncharacterized protein n=1 Tax=marine sediment metagenome TaxID=412755 RepID=A0A0F9T5V7_9ZZZZ